MFAAVSRVATDSGPTHTPEDRSSAGDGVVSVGSASFDSRLCWLDVSSTWFLCSGGEQVDQVCSSVINYGRDIQETRSAGIRPRCVTAPPLTCPGVSEAGWSRFSSTDWDQNFNLTHPHPLALVEPPQSKSNSKNLTC